MNANPTAITRAVLGLAQGLLLYLLYEANRAHAWPGDTVAFAPLWLMAIFVPVAIVVGLGTLPSRTLSVFVAAAMLVIAVLAAYDVYRVGDQDPLVRSLYGSRSSGFPSATLTLSIAAALFIAFCLAAAGTSGDRSVGKYARHFDVAWKLGVQFALAALFLGIFWLLLWLGAALFQLVKLGFLLTLITQRWFSIPVSAMVFVMALHLTDVQAGLVRGTRTLLLTLLAWLLPLMALLTWAFLLALLFTGLEPLWSTKKATALLLTAAAVLVFLINAAYQDGQPATLGPALIRQTRRAAALALLPLVALAGYALMLRVGQYGWTPERVVAAAVIAVAATYAIGYAIAVARGGVALTGLETTNFTAAYVILAALFVLLTPLADPARLAVADQVHRLKAGIVAPDDFDYAFLHFRSFRFGQEALKDLAALKEGPNAAVVAKKANDALANKSPWQRMPAKPATAATRLANIKVVHPQGQALPDSFVQQDWAPVPSLPPLPACLTAKGECVALLTDLDGDQQPEILLTVVPYGATTVFKASDEKRWSAVGSLANAHCRGVREALAAGKIATLPAAPFKDVEVNGQRLRVVEACAPPIETKLIRQN
jgi:Domain of unknown function (DUF4153)